VGRVIHFEIHASVPERAAKFYGDIFGWNITKWDGPTEYWLIRTGEGVGIDGAIVLRRGSMPAPGGPVSAFVGTIAVDSLDETIAAIKRAGGAIVATKTDIPGVGHACYGVDTEGNIFGMLQPVSSGNGDS
jgi:predicted enzyme related to lactoylglutathione lyase